jgi:glycosyltransferase involved in cell wall biosynthesis
MIEAMACGAPVIAYRRGSVPEIVDPGVTGWVVNSDEEAYAACRRASMLDRLRVRRRFEERFTAERMMRDYLELYMRHANADAGATVAA